MFKFSFILLLIVFSSFSQARQSCDWPFRTQVDITEQSGTNLNDYQIKLQLSTSNLHSSYNWTLDGFDFRIYDTDDTTPLEFWIDSWDQGNETASIWVRFPTLQASQNKSIFLYYGNENATPLATVPFTFIEPGIKFHARPTSFSPDNKTEAFNEFNNISDNGNNNDGYGCTFITNFTAVTKNATFGSGDNFAAYSESYFEVATGESGTWEFRYGADFGRGGALYVDDTTLEEDWLNDLWWANSWTNPDTLQGSITLNEGYHKLEVLGFEGCCDGGITVQFKKPGGSWTTFTTTDIDIRSRACPVTEPNISYGAHDVCDLVDLRFRNTAFPNRWQINTLQEIKFQIRNIGDNFTTPPSQVQIQLPTGLNFNGFSGTNWTCNASGLTINCSYAVSLATSGGARNSSQLTLTIFTDRSAIAGSNVTVTGQVTSASYDSNPGNNTLTDSAEVQDNNDPAPAVSPSCATPTPGIWSRFFNIQTYADTTLDNATDYQAIVNDRVKVQYLDGQTILSNINGSGNPFDNRGDEFYLTLFEGYINAPEDGTYTFGVDGDDAIEVWIDGLIASTFYGLHGENGSATGQQDITLAAGYHSIEYRFQEYTGGDSYKMYWQPPSNGNLIIIPQSAYFHCAGQVDINLATQVAVIQDDINGTNNPKAIPNAIMNIAVNAINQGNISTDLNTTQISQAIDAGTELYVNDFNGPGPINFVDGTNASNLSYQYVALNDGTDSISFSSDGSNFNHTATPDADGYDSAITHIRINFGGSFKAQMDGIQPAFGFEYQTRIK